jgi:hypothetical protein
MLLKARNADKRFHILLAGDFNTDLFFYNHFLCRFHLLSLLQTIHSWIQWRSVEEGTAAVNPVSSW